jgi:hypothetical protein
MRVTFHETKTVDANMKAEKLTINVEHAEEAKTEEQVSSLRSSPGVVGYHGAEESSMVRRR